MENLLSTGKICTNSRESREREKEPERENSISSFNIFVEKQWQPKRWWIIEMVAEILPYVHFVVLKALQFSSIFLRNFVSKLNCRIFSVNLWQKNLNLCSHIRQFVFKILHLNSTHHQYGSFDTFCYIFLSLIWL